MKVVAFLQNMWVRTQRSAASVAKWPPTSEQRERMIAYALFAGCLTGRRLKESLGDYWCKKIVWQEANPAVSTDPKEYFVPDLVHIRAVLNKHKPSVVICFTRAGEGIVRCMLDEGTAFVPCVHPACRAEDTVTRLRQVRILLDGLKI